MLELFDKVIKDSFWIFDLNVAERDEKVVHLPLVYASNINAELEAYGKAALHFVDFLGFDNSLQIRIVADCVFKFPSDQYQTFKLDLLEELSGNADIGMRLAELSIEIRNSFAANCVELERRFVSNKPIGILFEKTYQELVKLISINLSNEIFETAYLFLNENISDDRLFQEFQQKYLDPPTFSHLKWYAEQTKKTLKNKTNDATKAISPYFWNTVFLRQSINNANVADGIRFINQETNADYDLVYFKANYPIEGECFAYDPLGITDEMPSKDISTIEFLFYMIRLLQVNEEYRHYWQARFVRWMNLFFQDAELLKHSNFDSLQKIIKEMESH
ncbi:MAG: hypothetical protein GQ574_11965 [Crocinitomix sp.]|nr:hypothetical protein [Crocinitomix sp.]